MKRKALFSISILVLLCISLAGCSSKFVCSICGKEKTGKQYNAEILGRPVIICKDCKSGFESLLGK